MAGVIVYNCGDMKLCQYGIRRRDGQDGLEEIYHRQEAIIKEKNLDNNWQRLNIEGIFGPLIHKFVNVFG